MKQVRRIVGLTSLVTYIFLAMTACGGGATSTGTTSISSTSSDAKASQKQQAVSVFLQDAGADNVVTFRVALSSAALVDNNGTQTAIQSEQQTHELRHLELSPTLAVNAASVPSATYKSIALQFDTPQLTVVNDDGTVRQLTTATTPAVKFTTNTVSVPISLTPGSGDVVGVTLDFDLTKSISVDANGNYIVTPTLKSAVGTGVALRSTIGQVTALQNTNSMEVKLSSTGATIRVNMNADTLIESGAVQVGKYIDFDADFQKDGTYLARAINAGASDPSLRFVGVVTGLQQDSTGGKLVSMISH